MNIVLNKYPSASLIDGEWITSASTFPVHDPATGMVIARVPNLGIK